MNRKESENPSVIAEKKIIKASDAKQKSVRREKPNRSEIGRFSFRKTKKTSTIAEDQSSDPPAMSEL